MEKSVAISIIATLLAYSVAPQAWSAIHMGAAGSVKVRVAAGSVGGAGAGGSLTDTTRMLSSQLQVGPRPILIGVANALNRVISKTADPTRLALPSAIAPEAVLMSPERIPMPKQAAGSLDAGDVKRVMSGVGVPAIFRQRRTASLLGGDSAQPKTGRALPSLMKVVEMGKRTTGLLGGWRLHQKVYSGLEAADSGAAVALGQEVGRSRASSGLAMMKSIIERIRTGAPSISERRRRKRVEAFRTAVQNNQLDRVRAILSDLRKRDLQGMTAFLALQDFASITSEGMSALQQAVENGDTEIAHELITVYRDVDPKGLAAFLALKDSKGQTALHLAAMRRGAEKWNELIIAYRDADPKGLAAFLALQDSAGNTALYVAVQYGSNEMAHELIMAYREADPNGLAAYVALPNESKTGALHWAAMLGNTKMAHELITVYRDADPKNLAAFLALQDSEGMGALHFAAQRGRTEMAHHLIIAYRDADPDGLAAFLALKTSDLATYEGMRPLHWAATDGDIEMAHELIRAYREADPNGLAAFLALRDSTGKTALHRAAEMGHAEMAQELIAAYRDAHPDGPAAFLAPQDFAGKTALHLAAENGFVELFFALATAALPITADRSLFAKAALAFQSVPSDPERVLERMRDAIREAGIKRIPQAEFEDLGGYLEYLAFMKILAYTHKTAKAIDSQHLNQERGDGIDISPIFGEMMRARNRRLSWREQAEGLGQFTMSHAEDVPDMFRAIAREVVLGELLREVQGLGHEVYAALERALDPVSVQGLIDALVPSIAHVLISNAPLPGEKTGTRVTGKNVQKVLEFSQDWHKQIHGPLRRVRTIPREGQWHGLFLDENGAELNMLEIQREGVGEVGLPEEIEGWTLVSITNAELLDEEGTVMDHCVGSYAGDCLAGDVHIISVRDPQGGHQATVGLKVVDSGKRENRTIAIPGTVRKLEIFQNRGKNNKRVSPEVHKIFDWLELRIGEGRIGVNHEAGEIPTESTSLVGPLMQAVGYDPSERVTYTVFQPGEGNFGFSGESLKFPRVEEVFKLYAETLFTRTGAGEEGVRRGGHSFFGPFIDHTFYYASGLAAKARELLAREAGGRDAEAPPRILAMPQRPSPSARGLWELE